MNRELLMMWQIKCSDMFNAPPLSIGEGKGVRPNEAMQYKSATPVKPSNE